jgi:hypothetical protein
MSHKALNEGVDPIARCQEIGEMDWNSAQKLFGRFGIVTVQGDSHFFHDLDREGVDLRAEFALLQDVLFPLRKIFGNSLPNLVPHFPEDFQFLRVRPRGFRRIFKGPMQRLFRAGKNWTGFLGVVADRDDQIEGLVAKLIEGLAGVWGNVDP